MHYRACFDAPEPIAGSSPFVLNTTLALPTMNMCPRIPLLVGPDAQRRPGHAVPAGLGQAGICSKRDQDGRCRGPDPKLLKLDSGNSRIATARRDALNKATTSGSGHPEDTGPVRVDGMRVRPTRRWDRRDPSAPGATRPLRLDPERDCLGSGTHRSDSGVRPSAQAPPSFPRRRWPQARGAEDVNGPAGTARSHRRRASSPKRRFETPLRVCARGRCRS